MSEQLTDQLTPVLVAAGFVQVDVDMGEESSPVAGNELQFERTRGDHIDVILVFFDKYAAPRFQVSLNQRTRSELLGSAHLVERPSQYYHWWGKPWWLPSRFWTEGGAKRTVRQVVESVGQGIRYLETNERGPNISKRSGGVLVRRRGV
jgi:hypothetical protein